MVWCDVVLFGVVWCDVVLFGVVWFGTCGVVEGGMWYSVVVVGMRMGVGWGGGVVWCGVVVECHIMW